MMPQAEKISFVVFPDGGVDENSLTVSGQTMAIERCINAWLPEKFFGKGLDGYEAQGLWRTMSEKGFKVYTIEMQDGKPVLAE